MGVREKDLGKVISSRYGGIKEKVLGRYKV
jgi:hypothetical protein